MFQHFLKQCFRQFLQLVKEGTIVSFIVLMPNFSWPCLFVCSFVCLFACLTIDVYI